MADTIINFTTVEYPDEAAMNKTRDISSAEMGASPCRYRYIVPATITASALRSPSRHVRLALRPACAIP